MKTFLLTCNDEIYDKRPGVHWKPIKEGFHTITEDAAHLPFECYYGCGNRKNIQVHDEFYLLKQKTKSKGIIGFGQILQTPADLKVKNLKHWKKDAPGNYVRVKFIELIDPTDPNQTPLHVDKANDPVLVTYNWSPRSGGIEIPQCVTERLSVLWKQHLLNYRITIVESLEDQAFKEGGLKYVNHLDRERNTQVVKLAKETSKKPLTCCICSFVFSKKYGSIGDDFIEAHHKIPIHRLESGCVTKVKDIALVCSNCHRMLHRMKPEPDINKLRLIVQNVKNQAKS